MRTILEQLSLWVWSFRGGHWEEYDPVGSKAMYFGDAYLLRLQGRRGNQAKPADAIRFY
jgi:hypothetical protein